MGVSARSGLLLLLLALASSSEAQFADRIDPADVDAGADHISAGQARRHIGENRKICGLVSNVSKNEMNLGEPGASGYYGADLRIVAPAGTDLGSWYGKTACATGAIAVRRVAAYDLPIVVVTDPRQLEPGPAPAGGR